MRKILSYIFVALVSLLAFSCRQEDFASQDGPLVLDFDVVVPDMNKVVTKAVDPDGRGVQNIVLYCFDSYGLFLFAFKFFVNLQINNSLLVSQFQ